ncbi:UPF0598 protein CG30010 [Daphnia magna]|uniref:UPF0598 protein CG30010 n=1 Tax=Daphnia magna TaxID=35525 RepID=UPI0006E0B5D1|nr:UPF0598 protein CG30010 [Daphnia magna]
MSRVNLTRTISTRCRLKMFTKMRVLGSLIQRCFNHTCVFQYTQGQTPKPGIREYFYYIDHQGMLFLDDARIKNFTSCFKELKFLNFFFQRLKINDTECYQKEFPYLSLCGRERNYIRCDDLPVVFTALEVVKEKLVLRCNFTNNLIVDFQPTKLFMGSSGRIYHPGPDKLHGIGLIKSSLAIELSHGFTFGDNGHPTHFSMKSLCYKLDSSLKRNMIDLGRSV